MVVAPSWLLHAGHNDGGAIDPFTFGLLIVGLGLVAYGAWQLRAAGSEDIAEEEAA
jgi:hypothetical protein